MTAGPTASRASAHGWRLVSVRGVPVYLGRSWPVIAVLMVVFLGPRVYNPATNLEGGAFGYAVAVAYALILLLSVFAHEAAHAVTARRMGHRVDRVVADLMGGHTVYDGGLPRPGSSAAIAVVGPVANLVLAALGYGLQTVFPEGVVGLLLGALTLSNLFVGLFNLLPGLPLDGGFVVDALVWKATGDRNLGLIVAGWVGRVLTVVVVLVYVGRPLLEGGVDSTSLITSVAVAALIGAFMWAGASSGIKAGTSGRAMQRVPLMRVTRPVAGAGVDETLAEVLRRVGGFQGLVVAWDRSGRPTGLVDVSAAREVPPEAQERVPLSSVVARQPDGWVVVSEPGADISGVVDAIVSRAGRPESMPHLVLVLDPSGRPLGSVSLADLDAALGS